MTLKEFLKYVPDNQRMWIMLGSQREMKSDANTLKSALSDEALESDVVSILADEDWLELWLKNDENDLMEGSDGADV